MPEAERHFMEMLTPTVDIYLSAGPVTDTTDDPTYRSCVLDNVANCRIYRVAWNFSTTRAWKSPQWCHSEGFVVVTLTCSYTRQVPDVFGLDMFTLRVVLVDFRDRDAPILYGVTRELERLLNLDSGSCRAIFATCGTPL